MSGIPAPLWALTAEAIDGVGDTHLPLGIHIRALPSARLGIPATPLVVTRAVLAPAQIPGLARTDGGTWTDSLGTTVTLPFTVTPNTPVYGYFPVPNVVYAQLTASATSPPVPTPLPGPVPLPAPVPLPGPVPIRPSVPRLAAP